MPLSPRRYSARARLLATANVFAGCLGAAAQAAPVAATTDLGAVATATAITATVWLKPHDDAAFTAAVTHRMTKGDAAYHHWMTPAEVATYGATAADMDAVATTLQKSGLTVTARDADGAWVQFRGPATAIQAAFHTTLHNFSHAGQSYFAATTAPTVAGSAGALVAGVTGLTNAGMKPFIARQMDPSTGKQVPDQVVSATGGPVDLASYFTNDCFKPDYHYTYARFAIGGAVADKMIGPHYIGTGFFKPKACAYTAQQVRQHYGMPKLYAQGLKGNGKTIVIVDAYGSPTIQQDANLFSTEMGLPQLTAANFQVVYPGGQPTVSPYSTDWPGEISLDVEWAHAMAPEAKIVLVIAPTADDTELAAAVNYAVKNNLGDIISNSYGEPEAEVGATTATAYNAVARRAAAEGMSVFVATGDSGDFGVGSPVGAASIPADSPFVTGVGGTSLNIPSDTGVVDSVWGITATYLAGINSVANPPYPNGFLQGGGGGQSLYLEKPLWQKSLPGVGRQLPDVSAMADPYTGAIFFVPSADGTQTDFGVVGGTSLATPLMAGIWAVAEQAAGGRLGQAAPIIAQMPAGALNDIKPIAASAYLGNNLAGDVLIGGANPTYYSPADLLGIGATQPNGFVGTLARFEGPEYDVVQFVDIGFGTDSSLMAAPGWDNATGYGSPLAPAFVAAAKAAAK